MIRNVALRNTISAVLLVVAIAGIVTQVSLIRRGLAMPQTRLTIAGYMLVAIYAGASIAVRLRAAKKPPAT